MLPAGKQISIATSLPTYTANKFLTKNLLRPWHNFLNNQDYIVITVGRKQRHLHAMGSVSVLLGHHPKLLQHESIILITHNLPVLKHITPSITHCALVLHYKRYNCHNSTIDKTNRKKGCHTLLARRLQAHFVRRSFSGIETCTCIEPTEDDSPRDEKGEDMANRSSH